VSAIVPFERAVVVSYSLSVVTIGCDNLTNLPPNVSDAQINRGLINLEQKLGKKRLTDVCHILKRSARDMELSYSYAKEIVKS